MKLRSSRSRRALARSAELAWIGAAGLALALGLLGATALLGWATTSWLFLGTTVLGWFWAATRRLLDESPRPPRVLALGPVVATLLVASIGLVHLLGPVGVAVAGVLVVTHPDVHRLVRGKVVTAGWSGAPSTRTSDGARGPGPIPAPQTPVLDQPDFVVPDDVTDGDLCDAWCSSYTALTRARTDASVLRAVEMRALYLDDLERRLGDDFARWIGSLPRAAEDPRRFLGTQEPQGSTHDG